MVVVRVRSSTLARLLALVVFAGFALLAAYYVPPSPRTGTPWSIALPPDTLLVVGTDVNKAFWDSAASVFGLHVVYWDPSSRDYPYRLYIGPAYMPLMPPLFINPSFACYSKDLNQLVAGYGQAPQISNLLRYCGRFTCEFHQEGNYVYCYPNGNEYFKFPVREVNTVG